MVRTVYVAGSHRPGLRGSALTITVQLDQTRRRQRQRYDSHHGSKHRGVSVEEQAWVARSLNPVARQNVVEIKKKVITCLVFALVLVFVLVFLVFANPSRRPYSVHEWINRPCEIVLKSKH